MSEVSGGDDRDGARSAGPTPLARIAGGLPAAARLALRAVPDRVAPARLGKKGRFLLAACVKTLREKEDSCIRVVRKLALEAAPPSLH